MAQLLTVRLNKSDQQPLGFRLQGGKDFGTPLVVQKVNGGSAAERAGLQAGDALIRVNNTDVYTLRHQEAQDTIRAAGPMLELTVQRGGSTWRPSVTPTGSLPRPGSRPLGASPVPVTSTSLKATPQPSRAFGSGHNNVAKPFGYMNGSDSVKSIVNKQYNTPVNMYSDKTIAETLSAQTEVLAGGVLGVNFKKNEKTYDAEKSAVFKVLQEAENDPEPEPNPFYSRASVARAGTPSSLLRSHRSRSRTPRVETAPQPAVPRATTGTQTPQPEPERLAPEPPHRPSIPVGCHQVLPDGRIALGAPAQPPPDSALPVVKDTPHCDECYRYIVGVFVRIKDKNLHVECFKCSTCGTSLKNQGYYNINGKLYCDIHAKLVARQNPPALNLEPVTVPPGGRIPTNTYSTPLPPLATNNYTNGSSSLFSPSSNLSGPKPFGSSIGSAYSPSLSPRSGPVSPARPVNAPTAAPHMPFAPTKNVKSIVWPPPNPPEDEPSTQENIPNTCKPATTTDLSSKVPTESLLLQARNTSSSQAASEQLKSVAQVSATSTSQSTSEFSSNLSFSAASMSKAAATTSKVESIVESKQSQKVEQSSSCTVQSFSQQAASESQSVAVYQTNVTAQEAKKPNDQTISSIKSDIQKTIEESSNQMEQCAETKQSQVKKEETSNYNEEQQRSTQQKSENTNSNLLLAQKEETVSIQNEGLRDTNTTNQGSSVGVTPRGKNFGVSTAPRRGRGILNKAALPGSRVPLCGSCNGNIRGPFITALGRIWCPEHFICVNATCRRPLQDIGFVEENGQLYCEYCFEQYIAPACDKCHAKIKGDCLNAIGKHYHPECFICVYCGKVFGNNTFFLEDGLPYCEADWNELFTTKCFACGFPVEAGDRWVEALNNNYHSQCFNCTVCKKNLEGQSFFAKGGRPFCKAHAR
ncbi:PDZ and LIM domain protein Zasp isoform X8 [Aricia agestis]|uniref:PDZ and LIM domain protein Zasp isoform X8 n=1 Tax=Aricia agestis TaxID=91739 RepID=UPI001C2094F7|nr:PDZ and LIM domain protein Zasp isoform X8 [Aricia agestis]